MSKAVLLDSGFLIRLMNPEESLHQVAFVYSHAEIASIFMRTIIKVKQERGVVITPRVVIPNDTKMFAQASAEPDVFAFVSADAEAKKVYELLDNPNFEFVNIRDIR